MFIEWRYIEFMIIYIHMTVDASYSTLMHSGHVMLKGIHIVNET